MASGGAYNGRIVEAHGVGDLYIHGFGRTGGCWVSWNMGNIVGDSSSPLKKSSTFLASARSEWFSFQKLTGFESLAKETSEQSKTEFSAFFKSIEGVEGLRVFIGLEEQKRDVASHQFLESLFGELHSSGTCRISPLVFFSKDYDWGTENDLSIFESTGSIYSPIFQKRIGEITDYLADPWVDGTLKSMNTGVLDAVTLNIPRLAYDAKDEDDFIEHVGELTELAVEGLEAKRTYLEKELGEGRLPATREAVDSFDGFFCGVGVVGVHEAILRLIEKGINSMQGKAVAYKTLEEINRRLKAHWEETGHLFCKVAEPSDGVAYRFAELDRVKCPELKASGVETPFYTGSTCLPVDYSDDLWDAMEHQKKFQTLYTGGSVFNVYLERGISDVGGVKTLARRIVERTALPCFSFSPTVNTPQGRFERLGYWYKPVTEMVAGELEEVRVRRHYAVASGW
jgi:hypothetical protein